MSAAAKTSEYRVFFKDEDEVGGEPVGEVKVYTRAELEEAEKSGSLGVPFNPDRDVRWVTLSQARAVAAEHGCELEES